MDMHTVMAIALVSVVLVAFIAYYNRFVRLEQARLQAEGDVAAQLSQRWDLAPQIAGLVARYMAHEADLLQTLTKARHDATPFAPTDGGPFAPQGDGALRGAMAQFFARAEAYPQLRADTTFLHMQAALEESETQIAAARRALNAATAAYNAAIRQFPANVVAGVLGFRSLAYTSTNEVERARPAPFQV
jgi:LemA protein